MLTFTSKSMRISLTFGFFFVLGMSTLRDNALGGFSLLFCVIHELAHLFAMKATGAGVSEITFYGAGIKISSDNIGSLSRRRRALIYLSGPAANLLFAALLRGELRAINLFLGGFNLLPVSYFDGGRLAELFFCGKSGLSAALSIVSYIAIGAAVAAAVIFSDGSVELSALMSPIFIAMSYFLDA